MAALTCAQRHGWFPVGLGALGLAISLELRVTCHLAFFYDEVLASGMQRARVTHTAECSGPSHVLHRMRPVATCQLAVFLDSSTGRKPCLLFERPFHKVSSRSGFEFICTRVYIVDVGSLAMCQLTARENAVGKGAFPGACRGCMRPRRKCHQFPCNQIRWESRHLLPTMCFSALLRRVGVQERAGRVCSQGAGGAGAHPGAAAGTAVRLWAPAARAQALAPLAGLVSVQGSLQNQNAWSCGSSPGCRHSI